MSWHANTAPADALLLALLAASIVTDLKSRKIYNAFTYPAMLAGLLLNLLNGGVEFLSAAAACALGIGVFYPFYRAGGMGMGDLKLMAAIGALKGTPFWGAAMVDSALAGGVLALAVTAYQGTTVKTLTRSVSYSWAAVTSLMTGRRPLMPRGPHPTMIPYGTAIGAGTMAAWFFH